VIWRVQNSRVLGIAVLNLHCFGDLLLGPEDREKMFGRCGRAREVSRATALRALPSMDGLQAVGTLLSADGSAGGARRSFGKVTNFYEAKG
jgi:hypothetical protein